jgi:hypothetical protein
MYIGTAIDSKNGKEYINYDTCIYSNNIGRGGGGAKF